MNNTPFHDFSYTWDRLQDKFQLPDILRIFVYIKTFLDTTGQPFDYDPPAVGMAHGYLLRSANKILADYIISMPEPDETNPNDAVAQINSIIEASFVRKWQQLRDALYTPYDPLSPLDYTDYRTVGRTNDASIVETKSGTISTSDSTERTGTESNTTANDKSETINKTNLKTYGKTVETSSTDDFSQSQSNTTTTKTEDNESHSTVDSNGNGIFGFNSSDVSPATTTEGTSAESILRNSNGDESSAQINTAIDNASNIERNTGADTESGSDVHELHDSGTTVLSHSGNDSRISDRTENGQGTRQERGNANENSTTRRTGRYLQSPQELLQKEFSARQKVLLDTIYHDLDTILCIPVY